MLERRLRNTVKQITNPIGLVRVEKYSGLHLRSLDGHSALVLPHPQKPHSVYERQDSGGWGPCRVGSLFLKSLASSRFELSRLGLAARC